MTRRQKALFFTGFAGASVLAACSASELDTEPLGSAAIASGGSAGDASAAGDAGAPIHPATYYVPVPVELEPFATYPLKKGVRFLVEGGMVEIRYGFPRWLSGEVRRVALVGSYTEGATEIDVTAGELGTGTCTRDGPIFACREIFPGLPVDREKARVLMLEEGLPADEIEGRLKVTDSFAVDPIGILYFDVTVTVD